MHPGMRFPDDTETGFTWRGGEPTGNARYPSLTKYPIRPLFRISGEQAYQQAVDEGGI
jgi:hypothetical protein